MRPLSQLLQAGDPDSLVAFDGHHRYRRRDFLGSVSHLAAQLQAREEARWLLVHEDSYRFAIGLLALLAAGKHVVLPPNAQPGTLADLGSATDALLGNGNTWRPQWPIPVDHHSPAPLPLLDTDALSITLMTSGSSGLPKAITKPLRCFGAEILCLEQAWGERLGRAAVLASVSHQHIYGLLFRLLWPLCAGRAFCANTFQYPEPLVAAALQQPRCVLVSSPSQLRRFPPGIDLAAAAGHIAAVFSSGGPLPLAAALDWQARCGGAPHAPIEVFGSTETGGVAWRCQTQAESPEPWQPFPVVQAATQEDGLLQVQSPFIAGDGSFVMGDRVRFGGDGRFFLEGRADTVIKVEEKRLSLTAMEQHLQQSPWVAEARVLALPDQPGRLGAVVVLTEAGRGELDRLGRRAMGNALREHLLGHYERILLPRKWRFPASLPANSQGKTPLRELQQLFADGTTAADRITVRVLHEDNQQRVLQLEPGTGAFAGHFPELAILPGVVQLDQAIRACTPWYPLQQFLRIDRLKFMHPIQPGSALTLTLRHQKPGQVDFEYRLGEQGLSSGCLVFRAS